MEAVTTQLSISQVVLIPGESARDESWALFEAKVQKRQDLEQILAELQRCLEDQSSHLPSCDEMFRYDVNRALHEDLKPLQDALRERSMSICSVSTKQVEKHGNALAKALFRFFRVSVVVSRLQLRSVAQVRSLLVRSVPAVPLPLSLSLGKQSLTTGRKPCFVFSLFSSRLFTLFKATLGLYEVVCVSMLSHMRRSYRRCVFTVTVVGMAVFDFCRH